MGLLVDGVWRDQWYDTKAEGGRFVRPRTRFRNWVTGDGSAGPTGTGGFAAERDRYHLYVSLACPWAHRTLIMRTLKGLEAVVSLSVVHWRMGDRGWTFEAGPGVVADPVLSARYLYQANVTSSHAVIATADQRCWVEQEQVPQDKRGLSTTGAVVGALVGGFLGHQISDGKTIATVGGAAAGGALGANVNRITGGQQQAQTRDVQKCASVPSQTPTYWDVTYNFRGQDHRVQMATQPGSTVTVNEQGEPRA